MRNSILLILCLTSVLLMGQPSERRMTASEYVEMFKEDAIREMILHGVPASITLSQGMLESGNGNSALAVYANNHFGIKCHKGWTGETFIQDDDAKNECFRKYPSVLDSYSDHSEFLRTRSRYAFLFELKTTDYKGWARGLKKAGYATDPRYAERLIDIIELHKLYEFDKAREMPSITVRPKKEEQRIVKSYAERKSGIVNNRKTVVARSGESIASIAKELELGKWQLYKYNDFDKNYVLQDGEIVFIQPKKNKSSEEYHIVKKGETLHSISQKYGVKLKKILKYNSLSEFSEIHSGTKIYLKKVKIKTENPSVSPVVSN